MCSGNLPRVFLIIFNTIFVLSGIGLLGMGVWMKLDNTLTKYLDAVNVGQAAPLLGQISLILIIIGGVVLLVSLIGCCGAIKKSQPLLFLYAACLIVIMLAEAAVAVLAIVYKKKINDHLHDDMIREVQKEYGRVNDTTTAYDFLQDQLKCCGVYNYKDYKNSTWFGGPGTQMVPYSCCSNYGEDRVADEYKECLNEAETGNPSKYLNKQGCEEALKKWYHDHSIKLMIIGFCIAAIQIFGLVAACILRTTYKRMSYSK